MLQRVLNASARVLTGTHKFDRSLSRLLHTELHWLDIGLTGRRSTSKTYKHSKRPQWNNFVQFVTFTETLSSENVSISKSERTSKMQKYIQLEALGNSNPPPRRLGVIAQNS